ncbi:topoisomerase, partial [Listeria monocytogenes]|nr:topoisomerase [Listeria monocytogenes]EAG3028645.1 topoisomerase [Listeria monocytogenes]
VGINLTRLYTLYMQKNGMRGVFSVGRVQTPTLFLIYQRNEEIKHALALKLLLLELNSYDF